MVSGLHAGNPHHVSLRGFERSHRYGLMDLNEAGDSQNSFRCYAVHFPLSLKLICWPFFFQPKFKPGVSKTPYSVGRRGVGASGAPRQAEAGIAGWGWLAGW